MIKNYKSYNESKKDKFPKIDDIDLKDIVQLVSKLYSEYQQKEVTNKINIYDLRSGTKNFLRKKKFSFPPY